MSYLLDTGILLRLVDRQDPLHPEVVSAVKALIDAKQPLFTTNQNIAEFCNVATRPVANNGLGLPPIAAVNLLERIVEPLCAILLEGFSFYSILKHLIQQYSVRGKQIHDARLAAMMLVWRIDNILTLNDRDFRRFEHEGIRAILPGSVSAANP